MTRAEFLKLVEDTPRGWNLNSEGVLRSDCGFCPIEAVAVSLGQTTYGYTAAVGIRLGLNEQAVTQIIDAADNYTHTRARLEMRERLLRACGLEK